MIRRSTTEKPMSLRVLLRLATVLAAVVLVAAACGSDSETADDVEETDAAASSESESTDDGAEESSDDESDAMAEAEMPSIVVTTNILGDVVTQIVGDQANVVTIMPVGADPHDFAPSAQEVDQILSADALIVNGLAFEEGLLDVIDSAGDAGVPVFEATSAVATIEYAEGGGHDDHGHDDHDDHDDHGDEDKDEDHDDHDHDDHGDEDKDEDHDDHDHDDHGDEDKDEDHDDHDHDDHDEEGHDEEGHDDHGDEDKDEDHDDHGDEDHDDHDDHDDHEGHDHSGDDPHFFTAPNRMADAVTGIAGFLTDEVDGLDAGALETAMKDYVSELEALDAEVEALVEAIPADKRVLITNHAVYGYFADRYGFEVVGAVIPSGSTLDGTSAGELAELAEIIEDEGVPAIFSDVSASSQLIEALAAEVGDVAVVELYTESLGESGSDGGTYLDMVRTNASRISAALS